MGCLTGAEAAAAAGLTYRQFGHWMSRGVMPTSLPAPGSGNYHQVPTWWVPRLRLLRAMRDEMRSAAHGPAPHCDFLAAVWDAYPEGEMDCGAFTLSWDVDPEGVPSHG